MANFFYIDIMERELDFTFSTEKFPGLDVYVRELKANGIKFVTILVFIYLCKYFAEFRILNNSIIINTI